MQTSFLIIVSILVGIATSVFTNIIANWLQPTANRFPKTVISIFLGLTTFSIAFSFIPLVATPYRPITNSTTSRFGRVINSQTQQPVVGATVILEFEGSPSVKYTDSEGIYRFDLENREGDSQLNVKISAKDYIYYERNIHIIYNIPQLDDIRLQPISPNNTELGQTVIPNEKITSASSVSTAPPLPTANSEPTNTPLLELSPQTKTPSPTLEPTQPLPSPTQTSVPTVDPNILIEEDFQNGRSTNWSIERGDWNIINEQLVVTKFDAGSAELRVGDTNWKDYSVTLTSGRFHHDWGSSQDEVLRIAVRYLDSDNYVWFNISSFRIKYGIRKNGEEQEFGTKTSGANGPVIAEEISIRVKVRADTYELYINDEKFVSFEDQSRTSGGVNFIARTGVAGQMWVDNVKIIALP